MSALLQSLKTWFTRTAFAIGRRLQGNFFLYLAAVFTLLVLADAMTINKIGGMRQSNYDLMMGMRFNVPAPSEDIVIIDIDERTLATMAPEYGRWPWPRNVVAEFIERVQAQQPQAIVVDVVFTDADIQNPDADLYFNEVLAANANVFLTMVRLDSALDPQSELTWPQVPGARKTDPAASDAATVALMLPPFAGAQQPGRLGANNIIPDSDGVSRRYPLRLHSDGWMLPALPLTVAMAEGRGADAPDSMLINWRGTRKHPRAYPSISFSDVYLDMLKEKPERPANEFAGKVLVIGSTAAALGDIKGTPISATFPGVEILATAIDNTRSGDWIRAPEARWFYYLLALAAIWGTAFAFYRSGANAKVDKIYGLSAVIMLGFSYVTVNFGNLYINLSGAVYIGALYFSVARLYAFATERAMDTSVVARFEARDSQQKGLLLALHFPVETREEAALEKLATRIRRAVQHEMSSEILQGRQRGLWRLFENTLIVCWTFNADDEAQAQAIRAEVDSVLRELPQLVKAAGVAAALPADRVVVRRTEGRIRGNEPGDWRVLFAAALLDEGNAAAAGNSQGNNGTNSTNEKGDTA